jgi:hypothetical protein
MNERVEGQPAYICHLRRVHMEVELAAVALSWTACPDLKHIAQHNLAIPK